MKLTALALTIYIVSVSSANAESNAITQLINSYQTESVIQPSAVKGQQLWNKKFTGKAPFTERSCQSCHTSNLKQDGQHIRTKKTIKPLAPSINKESMTDVKKIKKWLFRNCKWTIGRECSAEEKIHLLTFLSQQ